MADRFRPGPMAEDPSPSYAELWQRLQRAEHERDEARRAVEILTAQKNALYEELTALERTDDHAEA